MMIYPTVQDLTKDNDYNRYEIAMASAKCARMITNEYTRQRMEAERAQTGNKDTDKPINAMIDPELRDEKAVKIAVRRLYKGEYVIVHKDPDEQEREEQAILDGLNDPFDPDALPESTEEDEDAEETEEDGETVLDEEESDDFAELDRVDDEPAADDVTE